MNTKINGLGIVLIWVGLFITAEQAYGTTINVPGDANTIQEAINEANDGDIVRVAEDTYYENLNFTDKNITLTSTDPNDADVVASTIIDGSDAGSVITFGSGDADSTVTGFTIKNGLAANGGGIYCSSASPIIRNCVITNNSATSGGGMYNYSADPDIINCVFNDNSATSSGGGIYNCYESDANLTNCVFYNNSATYSGGAVVNDGLLTANFTNCTLAKNTATYTGGVYIDEYTSATIKNCIFWDNTGGEIDITSDYASAAVSYSDIEGCGGSGGGWDSDFGTDGGGNKDSDPYFVDIDDADGSDGVFLKAHDGLMLGPNSPCVDAANGNVAVSTDIMGWPRVDLEDVDNTGTGDPNYVDMGAYEKFEYLRFGMEVVSVTTDANGITVVTTGATYVLDSNGMDMYRRIDPNTNAIDNANSGKGRKVAELSFDPNLGTLSVYTYDKSKAVIDSNRADFEFMSDSFFIITAKESLDVNHTNLITDAPWNAPLEPNDRGLDRMWTDGYGGSLHAMLSDGTKGEANNVNVNSTTITLAAGDKSGHMVFPPKTFDFEGLYGQNARPFVDFMYTEGRRKAFVDNTYNFRTDLINDRFGVLTLCNEAYDNSHWPTLLASNPAILGYNITCFDDGCPNDVCDFVAVAHDNDFDVIAYMFGHEHGTSSNEHWYYPSGHPQAGTQQDLAVTLGWMRDFQDKYNLDGWYFDGANCGDLINDYEFIRQVRTDVGNDGIIFVHQSADTWAQKYDPNDYICSGIRAIMLDAYVNYTLVGEGGWNDPNNLAALVDSPRHSYLRFFTTGYGMSQAYASHLVCNKTAPVSRYEIYRVLGENLDGCQYDHWDEWPDYFKPGSDSRRSEYLSDPNNFDPDVNWPIDPDSSWFRMPGFDPNDTNDLSWDSNSATVHWTTQAVNSDSEVTYTCDANDWYWWEDALQSKGPTGTVYDSNMVTDHTIILSGLESNTKYKFKIRSTNDANDPPAIPGQIIWGYVGSFTTDE